VTAVATDSWVYWDAVDLKPVSTAKRRRSDFVNRAPIVI